MKKKKSQIVCQVGQVGNRIMRLFLNYVEDRQHIENIQPIVLFLMG